VAAGASLGSIQGQIDLGSIVSVADALVTVEDGFSSAMPAYTDAAGHFLLSNLPPGFYDLLLSRSGFEPERLDGVAVAAGGMTNVGMHALVALDQDGDGVVDLVDTCSANPTPNQNDANLDGFGDACDSDYDDNGVVGLSDFNRMRPAFGSRCGDDDYDAVLDSNGDCVIGIPDFNSLRSGFGKPPGPSGLPCAGEPPCSP
jgi:hypothetical protein